MEYYIYQIKINGQVKYIGQTTDLNRREKEHNKAYKKRSKKRFYDWLHSINYTGEMRLEPIYVANNRVDAKRYEMFMMLHYYFEKPEIKLEQRIPNISDKF